MVPNCLLFGDSFGQSGGKGVFSLIDKQSTFLEKAWEG